MEEYRSQNIKIYPTDEQIKYFEECIKYNIDLYNYLHAYWVSIGKPKNLPNNKLSSILAKVTFNNQNQYAQCIKETCTTRFIMALKKYNLGQNGPPKIHKYGQYKQSFTLRLFREDKNKPNSTSFEIINNKYYFKCMFGVGKGRAYSNKNMHILMSEELKFDYSKYQAKTVTIFRKADNWWATFQVEAEIDNSYNNHTIDAIGIDMGIHVLMTGTDSNMITGEINWPEKLKVKVARLTARAKDYQKILSKKVKNSKSYIKYKIKLDKCYETITNMKNDFLHKTVNNICKYYKTIKIERLDIKSMVKRGKRINKSFKRDVYYQKWYYIRTLFEYKSKQFNNNLINLPKFYPSTQKCSHCGKRNYMRLGDETYICKKCGYTENRDTNASINILRYI